jgi:hypothetical protein
MKGIKREGREGTEGEGREGKREGKGREERGGKGGTGGEGKGGPPNFLPVVALLLVSIDCGLWTVGMYTRKILTSPVCAISGVNPGGWGS